MITFQVDDLLKEMALKGRMYFAPHHICQRLGTAEIEQVTDYLLSLVVQKKLVPFFRVQCPKGDVDFLASDPEVIPRESKVCHCCGVRYVPDPKNIWLIFGFTKEYVEYLKNMSLRSKFLYLGVWC